MSYEAASLNLGLDFRSAFPATKIARPEGEVSTNAASPLSRMFRFETRFAGSRVNSIRNSESHATK
jgi:hypothetical protein